MVRTLLTSKTIFQLAVSQFAGGCYAPRLTAWENHPDKVHEEIIPPEIQKFGSRICDLCVVVIEHAGCIIEDQTVDLAHADNNLERMAQGVRICDKEGYDEADRAPCELRSQELAINLHIQPEFLN
jgi:hypothetical protein